MKLDFQQENELADMFVSLMKEAHSLASSSIRVPCKTKAAMFNRLCIMKFCAEAAPSVHPGIQEKEKLGLPNPFSLPSTYIGSSCQPFRPQAKEKIASNSDVLFRLPSSSCPRGKRLDYSITHISLDRSSVNITFPQILTLLVNLLKKYGALLIENYRNAKVDSARHLYINAFDRQEFLREKMSCLTRATYKFPASLQQLAERIIYGDQICSPNEIRSRGITYTFTFGVSSFEIHSSRINGRN
ncbi:unnamed protein product [Nesidiocoris tenuis]|uniref:Uncharacterized protein n=1 Tax=Nesidiocoris tenuis TaxID=355587 RepID=A0A6H5HGJ5_9HEMI|nr:unnamed protein product [Nesidiocoris tenuis]